MMKIFLALTLVLVAGLLQNSGFFSVFGIQPNLLWAVLVAASFFIESFPAYLLLLATSIVLLRFESGFRPELLVFGFLAVSVFLTNRRLPWRRSVNNLALISVGVVLFYAIVDAAYLFGNLLPVAVEIVFTAIFGILFYDLFRQFGDNEKNIFKRQ